MKNTSPARRGFIKNSLLGIGSLAVSPVADALPSGHKKQPVDNKPMHIVCAGAHPGDPEFGCGGTMARYSDAGHKVTFLYLTRGEASDPKKTYAEMAALRTQEAAVSCKILNATPVFAGQIDGNTVLDKNQNEVMTKLILSLKPDVLFTQWPVDAHSDHQVTGMLSITAWIRSERKFHLYFYEVNTGSETMGFTPTDYADITAVRQRKIDAMYAHKTQDPVVTYNDYFKPLEKFRGLEAGVEAAEAFIHFKAADSRATMPGL